MRNKLARIKIPIKNRIFPAKPKNSKLRKQGNYLTAKEPEQRVAHIPPMVAPGPAFQKFLL